MKTRFNFLRKGRYRFSFLLLLVFLFVAAGISVSNLYGDQELIATDGGLADLYTINATTGSTSYIGWFAADC